MAVRPFGWLTEQPNGRSAVRPFARSAVQPSGRTVVRPFGTVWPKLSDTTGHRTLSFRPQTGAGAWLAGVGSTLRPDLGVQRSVPGPKDGLLQAPAAAALVQAEGLRRAVRTDERCTGVGEHDCGRAGSYPAQRLPIHGGWIKRPDGKL